MHLWNLHSHYNEPKWRNTWTAGLVGGAIGILIMGAFWYMQTKGRPRQRTPRQLGLGRHGQAPARSHIQLFSHPARQL